MAFENCYLPFGGHLRRDNRWVMLVEQIPWQQIDESSGELFSDDNGCPAKFARLALAAELQTVAQVGGNQKPADSTNTA